VLRKSLYCLVLVLASQAWSQTTTSTTPANLQPTPVPRITLNDAIQMATTNGPAFRAALAEAGMAREDRVQARAALLPGFSYTTGAIYTKPNGTDTGVFVAANGPREYLSQGLVHETLSFTSLADYRRSRALEALARAKTEIAMRGLVSTVVGDYYDVIATQRKYDNAKAAADEARKFVNLSMQLENGGEVAHSDVVKAELQANDRERELQDSQLAAEQAKLGLAVLIFPNFTPDYELVDASEQLPTLPEFAHIQDLATHNNPVIAAAKAALQASQQDVKAAIGGHLPSLSFDYVYGIDAAHYATYTNGVHNLGYQVAATLNLPVFDWGATQSKVKQAQMRRDLAHVELSAAQRSALANLRLFYNEAQTAHSQIGSLEQSVRLATEGLRMTTLRYQGGEATALEVVDAQNALLLAENKYADGTVRYRVSIANLQTLTGAF
jgi:outer membrane protein TolC